ncbi:MAG: hypothetical protein HUJ25_01040 [Crocinitomicaceae bacterium]|nr:hypothetical protein [Crocinitomicaceae bacterium]
MKMWNKILIASVLSLMVISCGKDRSREQKVSAIINKIDSPFFVASTSLQNLMDKSEVMKEGTLPFTQYQVISFFLDKELTGIDYNTDAQFIAGEGESFLPNFYGIFKIEKEESFIELIEVEANAKIEEKDGMKYAIKESEGYCVVWNEDIAIISNIPVDLAAMLSGKGNGGQKMVNKNIELIKAAEDGDINEDYVAFLEHDADISMHYEGAAFYKYMESMSMEKTEDLEAVKEMYEGMKYDMFMNFNKGNMEMEMVADLSDKLKKELSFMGKDGVSKSLFAYGKSANPMLTGTYKLDISGFLDYFKTINEDAYDEMVNDMEKSGLDINEVSKAFSGELVYMIEEVVKKEEVYDFGYEEPITINNDEPIFGIVVGVSDKGFIETKLKEVIIAQEMEGVMASDDDKLEQMDAFKLEDEMPEIEVLDNGVIHMGDAFIFLGDNVLFMSNDEEWTSMVAAGNTITINDPKGVLTENPFCFYLDFAKVAQMDMGDDEEAAKALKMFKSFHGSANLDGGKFTLEFTDDSENSLKLLTMAVGAAMADFEKQMNPGLEDELEEAIKDTEDAFEKLDEELKNVNIEESIQDVKSELEDM